MRNKVYTNFPFTGQSLYGKKFIPFIYLFSVIFEAENWTMEEITAKLPHVKHGGDHSPTFCRPRFVCVFLTTIMFWFFESHFFATWLCFWILFIYVGTILKPLKNFNAFKHNVAMWCGTTTMIFWKLHFCIFGYNDRNFLPVCIMFKAKCKMLTLGCVFENNCTVYFWRKNFEATKNINDFRHNVAILVAYRNRYVVKYSIRLCTFSILP